MNVIELLRSHSLCALRRLAPCVVVATLGCSASGLTSSRGAPCGRNQHAFATAVLPDTGINAGRALQVGFVQHDPDMFGELSEVVIQQSWSESTRPDSEPDPRVRLVDATGRILLDTLGTRFDQPGGGRTARPTWYVLQWLRDAGSRNALYDAFANQALWLELRRPLERVSGSRPQNLA
jgi:hypothetical protein